MSAKKGLRTALSISSWVTFAISLALYWITADPGVSYWDCPEYVTSASLMEVGHPPGNPVWMITMRVATIPFDASCHAYVINLCSGLFMAFASFFLCRIIFVGVRSFFYGTSARRKFSNRYVCCLSSFISIGASLCFSLCDSVWFSAVEAEVYAMSVFLSSLSLWLMTKWWKEKSVSKRYRLLILVAYIIGLSLGVHQLCLLLIPVYALIIIYKKHPRKINSLKIVMWVLISCGLIGLILMLLLPAFLVAGEKFELFGVNDLGLPYHSGIIVLSSLLLLLCIIGIILCLQFRRKDSVKTGRIKLRIQVTCWIILFLLIGFSSYGIILIRGGAYPYMNEGVPDNIFALRSYFLREQYPSSPILYGHTPYSQPMFQEEFIAGKPVYSKFALKKEHPKYQPVMPYAKLNHRSGMLSSKDSAENQKIIEREKGYLLSDYGFRQIFTPELNMCLPRITSRKIGDRLAYEDWAGMTEGKMKRLPVSIAFDTTGLPVSKIYFDGSRPQTYSYRPTYLQNLRFFMAYQAYYMYFRYLFWNFIGRQNDYHSTGEIEHGNFITGISSIDRYLGTTEKIPLEIGENNKGRNQYFGIPFIMGIFGIVWLLFSRKRRRVLTVTFLLFLMTGLAIVVYLNQSPGEPRERDYTFLTNYLAFSLWIAAGILGVTDILAKRFHKKIIFIVCVLISMGIPTLMAIENFDDHDRRGRFEPTFYASSLLDFEVPSIIFTHGDNSTFPVWYASEVLKMGEEHTPVDITYLSLPSYVVNLKKQGRKELSTIISTPEMAFGGFLLSKIPSENLPPIPLGSLLRGLYKSEEPIPVFPSSSFLLPISCKDSVVIKLRDLSGGSSYLSFRHLMLLDIMAAQLETDNPKAIFFPSLIDHAFYAPLDVDGALRNVLFGKIYAPWLSDSIVGNMMDKSIDRELLKLSELKTSPRYSDPVNSDRSKRYRGEMLLGAEILLNKGDTIRASNVVETLLGKFNYGKLLPGDFTLADSTYYEGKEFKRMLNRLYEITNREKYLKDATFIDSIMQSRYLEWLHYYHSLTPTQRQALSNRSKRLLIN